MTDLRKLYEWLRMVSTLDVHAALAAGFAERPIALRQICERGLEALLTYNAPDLFIDEPRGPLNHFEGPVFTTDDHVVAAIQTAANQAADHVIRFDFHDLDFSYVERELNPLRTRNAIYETGEPASDSGIGGMDVLLKNCDGTPIVGEIKVGNDTNPFLGLIQALTYAIELSTPNQRQRLANNFYAFNELLAQQQPCVDVYLILANYAGGGLHDVILEYTRQIANGLCGHQDVNWLRRIVCLHAAPEQNGAVTFTPHFVAP